MIAGSGTTVCEFSSGITKANVYEPLSGDDLTLRSNTADASDAGSVLLAGGGTHAAPGSSQTRGAHVEVAGNEHVSRPGRLSLCAGSTGDVRFFDSDGTAVLVAGTTGITMDASDSLFTASLKAISTNITMLGASAGSLLFGARALTDGSDGAAMALHADNHATYPGALHLRAPLDTRAASTAFSIAPVATGDVCRAELLDNAAGSLHCIANVDSAGTVTFLNSDAKYVNSSSPSASQIGLYINAGMLTCKPGSGFAGKIAVVNVRIGKA